VKNFLKAIASAAMPNLTNKLRAANLLLDSPDSYLIKTGWFNSFLSGSPARPDGTPLPWMNYSFVNFLEGRMSNSHRLFEYGSGFSTAFYAKHVMQVVSVEHDQDWFGHVVKGLPSNATVLMRKLDQGSEYEDSFLDYSQDTDIVVVDGRRRVKCCEIAFSRLKFDAVVVLDDSYREKYQPAFAIAKMQGFKSLRIQGLKPTGHWVEETTVFYRAENCLGL
jgi:hypothetical protein